MTLKRFRLDALMKKKGEGTRQRILYVEDDDDVWAVTQFALREDYDLRRAALASEVFFELERNTFDLILCDVELQGSDLDGIEITQALRGRYQGSHIDYRGSGWAVEIPVIFVTAFKDRFSKSQLLAAGGDDVIYKPVDFTRLSLAISRLVLKNI